MLEEVVELGRIVDLEKQILFCTSPENGESVHVGTARKNLEK